MRDWSASPRASTSPARNPEVGFRVSGLGFRVEGLGFRVQGLGIPVMAED